MTVTPTITAGTVEERWVVPELDALSVRELGALLREHERRRRHEEVVLARIVAEVDRRGEHRIDGHRNVAAWCRALTRCSSTEATARVRTGHLLAASPELAEATTVGAIGVAQLHELGRAFANPRVGAQLVDVVPIMLQHAERVPFHEFRLIVRRWESLADLDGSHRDAAGAHDGRDATVVHVGDEMIVTAHGGLGQGAVVKEIFDRFVDAEFTADWEATVARYGDDAAFSLMPRTDAQRRFDALVRIFERAAAMPPDAKAAQPLVELVVDLRTLDELLHAEPTLAPDPDPRRRRCETRSGIPLPLADVVAAMWWGHVRRVVVDDAGVVVDLGRRSRLFRGGAREAAMLQSTTCVWPGCLAPVRNCEADHLVEHRHGGPTDARNAGPMCGPHNRWKSRGFVVWRDEHGYWHTCRPDGTEIR